MTPFAKFMSGLRADARLSRHLPAPNGYETPETVILALLTALADAVDRAGLHPAIRTLEGLDDHTPNPLRTPFTRRGRVGLVMGER